MGKTIRNTVFTIAAIGLTALGLKWNNAVRATQSLAAVDQTVLAAESTGPVTPSFPLTISLSSPQPLLGQTETVTITTVPYASLDIVTRYPDGSTNHPQTFPITASGNGTAAFSLTVTDFRSLGTFQITAVASSGSQTTEATTKFSVINWQPTGTGQTVYPLVP